MPELLRNRPLPLQIVLGVVLPALFGALAGWLLTVNEIAYIVISVLALVGIYFAGREHIGAGEGALRGLVAGLFYGGATYLVYKAIGKEAKAELPDPEILLIPLAIIFSVAFAAMGGAWRKRKEEESEEEADKPAFSPKRVNRSELIGFVGAAVLAFAIFALDWFETNCKSAKEAAAGGGCNPNSKIKITTGAGEPTYGSFSAWETYAITRFLLLAACVAPFLLAYIIARGHKLSWRTGEVTMIVGMVAFALILLNGIILGTPGSAQRYGVDISLKLGYLVGLIGALLIAYGGFRRQSEDIKAKPPGV